MFVIYWGKFVYIFFFLNYRNVLQTDVMFRDKKGKMGTAFIWFFKLTQSSCSNYTSFLIKKFSESEKTAECTYKIPVLLVKFCPRSKFSQSTPRYSIWKSYQFYIIIRSRNITTQLQSSLWNGKLNVQV